MAAKITIDDEKKPEEGHKMTILQEFWHNFTHNLFKPLLLFFYLGFLVPILKVEFEFPYVIYQGLTIYLLLAIGWHGGEELAKLDLGSVKSIVGFMGVGFVTNFIIGVVAYLALKVALSADAPRRPGDGCRLLRVGLRRYVRDLPGRAGNGPHRV